MSKVTGFLLAFALVVAACGGSSADDEPTPTPAPTATGVPEPTATPVPDDSAAPGLDLSSIDPALVEQLLADPDAAIALLGAFGIDEELAGCLQEQLADRLADFDFEDPDLSILDEQVCGTTLNDILGDALAPE